MCSVGLGFFCLAVFFKKEEEQRWMTILNGISSPLINLSLARS